LVVSACSLGGPPDDASGEEIYTELCTSCHGADLSGGVGPALGPGSNAEDESDEFLVFTITNGRGRMPSFESTLNEEQVDRLVGYIREVQDG
jgi:mono/diheme cytochrome c family protein